MSFLYNLDQCDGVGTMHNNWLTIHSLLFVFLGLLGKCTMTAGGQIRTTAKRNQSDQVIYHILSLQSQQFI